MPYLRREFRKPKFQIRLQDLTARDHVRIECIACGHSWAISPWQLHDYDVDASAYRLVAAL